MKILKTFFFLVFSCFPAYAQQDSVICMFEIYDQFGVAGHIDNNDAVSIQVFDADSVLLKTIKENQSPIFISLRKSKYFIKIFSSSSFRKYHDFSINTVSYEHHNNLYIPLDLTNCDKKIAYQYVQFDTWELSTGYPFFFERNRTKIDATFMKDKNNKAILELFTIKVKDMWAKGFFLYLYHNRNIKFGRGNNLKNYIIKHGFLKENQIIIMGLIGDDNRVGAYGDGFRRALVDCFEIIYYLPYGQEYELEVKNIVEPKTNVLGYPLINISSQENNKIVQLVSSFKYEFILYKKSSKVASWQEDFAGIKMDTVIEKTLRLE